eukprot:1464419-Pyramimonas_sp.AAC.1
MVRRKRPDSSILTDWWGFFLRPQAEAPAAGGHGRAAAATRGRAREGPRSGGGQRQPRASEEPRRANPGSLPGSP